MSCGFTADNLYGVCSLFNAIFLAVTHPAHNLINMLSLGYISAIIYSGVDACCEFPIALRAAAMAPVHP